jgi:hypothetical protein
VVTLKVGDIDSTRMLIRVEQVLPKGFHRIRHYGFLASADR